VKGNVFVFYKGVASYLGHWTIYQRKDGSYYCNVPKDWADAAPRLKGRITIQLATKEMNLHGYRLSAGCYYHEVPIASP
jgi:hypothetical protein